VNIAAGDLGAPAAEKYEIEYLLPVGQTCRELTLPVRSTPCA